MNNSHYVRSFRIKWGTESISLKTENLLTFTVLLAFIVLYEGV